jgi:acyl-CoA reductase-like NAD-dependent aldehyde dehydrogenase
VTRASPWDGAPLAPDPEPLPDPSALVPPADPAALDRLAAACAAPAARAAGIALLVREAGKTAADAAAELDLLPRKIVVTREALALTPAAAADPAGAPAVGWRPRGLALALGPFNFPLHLLHGLVVPAVATGNPVVAKVSERTPGLADWYRARIAEAGLAASVAVTATDAGGAAALLRHPRLATVALVGSRRSAAAVARTLADRPEVATAFEMGGVNPALVCADADLPAAAAAIAEGAFRMAGQRCTATRQCWVPRRRSADLLALLDRERERWAPTGTPDGPLGPLISRAERDRARERLAGMPGGWERRGGDGWGHAGLHPALLIAGPEPWPDLDEELFAPVLAVHAYDDEDAAIARLAAIPQRLAAAVWTTDRARFAAIAGRLVFGQVSHNRGTAGARADLPFGGCGASGNGRPAARSAARIFADECVVW